MSAVSSSSSPPASAGAATGMGESPEVASFKQRLQALEQSHPKLEENNFFEELFKDASRYFDSELGSRAKLTTPSAKQQRLANILGLAEFFFQASQAAVSWLEEAYTARVGDQGVEILLKVLRCVPVSVSEIVRQATKGKDSRFRAQVVDLCVLKAPSAAFGRRCGDVPTMNHTLDLVFHLNKLKLSMEKTGGGQEGLNAVVGAWIAQFQGQQSVQDPELELRFLNCTTPQEFKDLTVEMIKTAEFEKDGEATMNLVLLGAEADSQHALQGFGSHLGIGRFGCSVYFTFPQQEQCLMDVAFWNLSRAVVSVCEAGGVQIELTAKANADTSEAVSKAAGGAVRAGKEEYTLRFRISPSPESVDELQNTIDRRRFRFIKGAGENRVSKVTKPLMNSASGKAPQPKVASPLVFRKREELAMGDSPQPVVVVVPQVERDELPNTDITEVEDIDSQLGGGLGSGKTFVSKRKVDTKPLAVALVRSGISPLDMASMTIADLFSLTKNYHAHLLANFFNIGGKLKSGRNKKLLIEALREDGESKPGVKKARLSATKPKTRVVQSDDDENEEERAKPSSAAKKRKAASPRPRRVAEQLSPGDEPSFGDEFDFLTSANGKSGKSIHRQEAAAATAERRNTRLANKVLPSLEQDDAYYGEEEPSKKKPRRDQESSLPDPPQSPASPLPAAKLSPTAPLERFVAAVARTPPTASVASKQQLSNKTTPTTAGGGTQKTLVFASQEENEDSDDLLLPAPRVLNFKSATLATERVTGLSPSPAFSSTPSPLLQPLLQPAVAAVLPQPDFDLLSPPAVAQPPLISAPKRAMPRLAEISPLPPVTTAAVAKAATTAATSMAKKPKPVAIAAAPPVFKDDDDDSAVSSPSSDGEQDDFETEEIQNDAVLECRSAIASIHRAIQKVASRRNRQDKRNDKLFRHTMHQGSELVAAIHRAEKRFLDQVDKYELLVAQRQARVQARALAVAQRNQYLQQLKRDAERVKRDIARHQAELQQALQQAAQSLAQSSKRQLGDIQKLLAKQKKDAKEWKPPVPTRNGSSL
ncbi:hypothetical protein BASA81_012917 [Batrachochytrium salamandrivorans]|nr:hypothetical protein BASA81_012917 [Batrachochytrium salamandrivorans]